MTVQRPRGESARVGAGGTGKSEGAARVHLYRPVEERVARGLARREAAPLEGHARYATNRRRKNPVAILQAQDDARVQDLVPIRYGRMSASAFAFYRGSPHHIPPPLHRTLVSGIAESWLHRRGGRTGIVGRAARHLALRPSKPAGYPNGRTLTG